MMASLDRPRLDRPRITRFRDATPPAHKGNGHFGGSFLQDTLVNLVTGLGTPRDKLANAQYALTVFTQPQLEAAYRTDWIARKIINLPAQDATRAWRQWQAEDKQIETIEKLEEKFDIQNKTKRGMIRGRLYGGAAIIMGIDGTGGWESELDVERVRKDTLKFLHVVNRYEIGAELIEADITSPWFDLPKHYTYSTREGQMLKIHPSRVVRFVGEEIPSRMSAPDSWGDSVLQICNDAIIAAASVAGAIANLVEESKTDILKIPGLSENLGNPDYENRLHQRVALATQLKAILRTTVIDSEEELERIVASFASLPDLFEVYLMVASGAADIPATRMLGQSPRGLNATGEADIRNYYDRISSDQVNYLQPALSVLDEVIIRSALGSRPPEIYYDWNPLWQMTPEQKAELAKKKAEAFQIEVNLGLINPDVLREVRLNQLTEDGTYPGIEDAVEEFGAEPEEPEVDEEAIAALMTQQSEAMKTRSMLPKQEDFAPKPKLKAANDARFYDRVTRTWYDAEWNEADHPRHPAGRPEGGEFAPKGGGGLGEAGKQTKPWWQGQTKPLTGPYSGASVPATTTPPSTPSLLRSIASAVARRSPIGALFGLIEEFANKHEPELEVVNTETGEVMEKVTPSELTRREVMKGLAAVGAAVTSPSALTELLGEAAKGPFGNDLLEFLAHKMEMDPDAQDSGVSLHEFLNEHPDMRNAPRDEQLLGMLKWSYGPDTNKWVKDLLNNAEEMKDFFIGDFPRPFDSEEGGLVPESWKKRQDEKWLREMAERDVAFRKNLEQKAIERGEDPAKAWGKYEEGVKAWQEEQAREAQRIEEYIKERDRARAEGVEVTDPRTGEVTKGVRVFEVEGGYTQGLEKHTAMRDYTPKELDWEYEREYGRYMKPRFPDAFSSREDFQQQYDAAPLVHLSLKDIRSLENSMASSAYGQDREWLEDEFGHRRDVGRIVKAIEDGYLPPPIVLQSEGRRVLMSGQTRLAAGLVFRKSIPVKLIDISKPEPERVIKKVESRSNIAGDRAYWAAVQVQKLKDEWVEADHPRHPAGTSEGGQFAPKGGGGGLGEVGKQTKPFWAGQTKPLTGPYSGASVPPTKGHLPYPWSISSLMRKVPGGPLVEFGKMLLEQAEPELEVRDPETGELIEKVKPSELPDPLDKFIEMQQSMLPKLREVSKEELAAAEADAKQKSSTGSLTQEELDQIIAEVQAETKAEAAAKLKAAQDPGQLTMPAPPSMVEGLDKYNMGYLQHLAELTEGPGGMDSPSSYSNFLEATDTTKGYTKETLQEYLKWAHGSAYEAETFAEKNVMAWQDLGNKAYDWKELAPKPTDYNVDWLEQMADKVDGEEVDAASDKRWKDFEKLVQTSGIKYDNAENKLHAYLEFAKGPGAVEKLANDPANWDEHLVMKSNLVTEPTFKPFQYSREDDNEVARHIKNSHPELENFDSTNYEYSAAQSAFDQILKNGPPVSDYDYSQGVDWLKEYSDGSFDLNKNLRDLGSNPDLSALRDPDHMGQIFALDNILDSARTTEPMLLWRGTGPGTVKRIKDAIAAGKDTYVDYGYMSASTRRSGAAEFRRSDGAMIPIVVPPKSRALPIHHLSDHKQEYEVVLARRTNFRIRKTVGGATYLEVIPEVD